MAVHTKGSRFWEREPGAIVAGNEVGMGIEERMLPLEMSRIR